MTKKPFKVYIIMVLEDCLSTGPGDLGCSATIYA